MQDERGLQEENQRQTGSKTGSLRRLPAAHALRRARAVALSLELVLG